MRFRELPLRCVCGLSPTAIGQVGLTAEHQLVVRWRCTGCKMEVYVLKDLADCWRDCAKPETAAAASGLNQELVRHADEEFLHRMGVRFS